VGVRTAAHALLQPPGRLRHFKPLAESSRGGRASSSPSRDEGPNATKLRVPRTAYFQRRGLAFVKEKFGRACSACKLGVAGAAMGCGARQALRFAASF
jgi:hypothetical protein